MSRVLIAIYGGLACVVGLGGLVLLALFVGDWPIGPWQINARKPTSMGWALIVNVSLMAVFAVQHSVMARPAFKKLWIRVIPAAAQRSTYVLLSGVSLVMICVAWQPLPGTLWHVEYHAARNALTALQLFGWGLSVVATFSINPWELLGLEQVYKNLIRKAATLPEFSERGVYRFVRHPIQLGLLIGFWSAPTLTMTHLMLSATMTLYIFVGLYFEERDLVATLGKEYEDYRRRVPMLMPLLIWTRRTGG